MCFSLLGRLVGVCGRRNVQVVTAACCHCVEYEQSAHRTLRSSHLADQQTPLSEILDAHHVLQITVGCLPAVKVSTPASVILLTCKVRGVLHACIWRLVTACPLPSFDPLKLTPPQLTTLPPLHLLICPQMPTLTP